MKIKNIPHIIRNLPEIIRVRYDKYRREKLLHNAFVWRFIFNPGAAFKHWLNRPKLDEKQKSILAELNEKGIAIFNFTDIFSQKDFDDLVSFYDQYQEKNKEVLDTARGKRFDQNADKTYLHTVFDEKVGADESNPMFRIPFNERLMAVANEYYGLLTRFNYYDIWHSFIYEGQSTRSQLWHRDGDDRLIFKCFVYLSDVDEGCGPTTYAPRTHPKGEIKAEPEWFYEPFSRNKRSTDEQMEKVVPRKDWIVGTGKKGTMIICDTRGLHKGGHATEKERIMFVFQYLSGATHRKRYYQISDELKNRLVRSNKKFMQDAFN